MKPSDIRIRYAITPRDASLYDALDPAEKTLGPSLAEAVRRVLGGHFPDARVEIVEAAEGVSRLEVEAPEDVEVVRGEASAAIAGLWSEIEARLES